MAKKKPTQKETYKRGTLIKAIYAYFLKVGLDKVTYEATEKLAKQTMPKTKFNRYHYAWYRNDFPNWLEKQTKAK